MEGPQITLHQYQAPSLHEAGHAVVASVLGRKLIELSVLQDKDGNGYVYREIIDLPGLPALEEIAILLAGEAAPEFWGRWPTPAGNDWQRVEEIVKKRFPSHNARELSDLVEPCLKSAFSQLKDVLAVLTHELSIHKKLSGAKAEDIIKQYFPPEVALRQCLANLLGSLSA